jgi:glutamyl-tRNA reductase
MLDSNGSNTTAVAAVLAAGQHIKSPTMSALVLAATGPVGQRIAQLVVGNGGSVTVVSRSRQRAESLCQRLAPFAIGKARCEPVSLDERDALDQAYARSNVVFSAGAAGVPLARLADLAQYESLKVVVDLNAVPPLGIEGVDTTDRGIERNGLVCYGALAVGRTKMKIHREAIRRLFTRSDLELDAPQLMALGLELTAPASI